MSAFGGPGGGQKVYKPSPPERGSFPLDHDGECKTVMANYLRCIKAHRGSNDPECRMLSKSYLQCRMERNLMAPDSFKNLGFEDVDNENPATAASKANPATATATSSPPSNTTTTPSQRQSQN